MTFPNGAYVVEVELDPATGGVRIDRFTGVDDIGRIINPQAAVGQLHGGIAQGIGEALLEGMTFDGDGQLQTGSLMDYALPRADDLPAFDLEQVFTPSPNSPLNVKGAGELPILGAPGAAMNAVVDAMGVRHVNMPLGPEKLWRALKDL